MERLACPVEGAIFVDKLLKAKSKAATPASSKKRPKAPELEDAPQPAKKRAKSKAKAKASAKTGAKAKAGKQAVLQDGETLETMQADVSMGAECPDDYRPRLWFDDLLMALTCCRVRTPLSGDFESSEAKLWSTMLGYGLEFACTASVVLKKKAVKEWSKAGRRVFTSAHVDA